MENVANSIGAKRSTPSRRGRDSECTPFIKTDDRNSMRRAGNTRRTKSQGAAHEEGETKRKEKKGNGGGGKRR
jgi:hypothetical protein